MTLENYIDEVKYEIADDNAIVNAHHNSTKIIFAINKARREINQDLKLYTKQMFLIPSLAIDSYEIPSDYLRSANVVDVKNALRLIPAKQEEAEILDDDSYVYKYGNLFYVNERKRKLIFLSPPQITDIPTNYLVEVELGRNIIKTDLDDISDSCTINTNRYWVTPTTDVSLLSLNMRVYGTSDELLGTIIDIDPDNDLIKLSSEIPAGYSSGSSYDFTIKYPVYIYTVCFIMVCGINSVVECLLAKQNVIGSNPISRSRDLG